MYKLDSLRAHLLAHVPGLQADALHTFVEGGHIESTASQSMSFVYHYKMQVVMTDYSGNADAVMLPVLRWLRTHQPELFLSPALMADAFKFEVDVLNHQAYDLGITLKLSERVSVHTTGSTAQVQHHSEPPLDPYSQVERWQLYVMGELVSEWDSPPPDPLAP